MTVSLGECLFDLPENSNDRASFPLEKSQSVPKTDDFSLFCGVHEVHSALNQCERKENKIQAARLWACDQGHLLRALRNSEKKARLRCRNDCPEIVLNPGSVAFWSIPWPPAPIGRAFCA